MQYDQIGVIPYRETSGQIEVLLITSRSRGRWIVPKGNIENELGPKGTAHLEALEEAGVEGWLERPSLGVYEHGDPPESTVKVYLMAVDNEHEEWEESDERSRQWLSLEEARETVDELGLRRLLDVAAARLKPLITSNSDRSTSG